MGVIETKMTIVVLCFAGAACVIAGILKLVKSFEIKETIARAWPHDVTKTCDTCLHLSSGWVPESPVSDDEIGWCVSDMFNSKKSKIRRKIVHGAPAYMIKSKYVTECRGWTSGKES